MYVRTPSEVLRTLGVSTRPQSDLKNAESGRQRSIRGQQSFAFNIYSQGQRKLCALERRAAGTYPEAVA